MSGHAEDAFNATSIRRADQDVGVAVGRSDTDSMNAHAEGPFNATSTRRTRTWGSPQVDRVPIP